METSDDNDNRGSSPTATEEYSVNTDSQCNVSRDDDDLPHPVDDYTVAMEIDDQDSAALLPLDLIGPGSESLSPTAADDVVNNQVIGDDGDEDDDDKIGNQSSQCGDEQNKSDLDDAEIEDEFLNKEEEEGTVIEEEEEEEVDVEEEERVDVDDTGSGELVDNDDSLRDNVEDAEISQEESEDVVVNVEEDDQTGEEDDDGEEEPSQEDNASQEGDEADGDLENETDPLNIVEEEEDNLQKEDESEEMRNLTEDGGEEESSSLKDLCIDDDENKEEEEETNIENNDDNMVQSEAECGDVEADNDENSLGLDDESCREQTGEVVNNDDEEELEIDERDNADDSNGMVEPGRDDENAQEDNVADEPLNVENCESLPGRSCSSTPQFTAILNSDEDSCNSPAPESELADYHQAQNSDSAQDPSPEPKETCNDDDGECCIRLDGETFGEWNTTKKAMRFETDVQMAKFLMKRWVWYIFPISILSPIWKR